jgi:hypothetical protein
MGEDMSSITLNSLFNKYGSDKGDANEGHAYGDFYERFLPKSPKRMLEIGIKNGASARAWKEWFPDVEFHGLDLFIEHPIPEDIDAIWHQGNQCDYLLLEKLREFEFDIIIDDGSHVARHQMVTFFSLMHAKCTYVIEDIHCCAEEFYRQGLPPEFCADMLLHNPYHHPKIALIKC